MFEMGRLIQDMDVWKAEIIKTIDPLLTPFFCLSHLLSPPTRLAPNKHKRVKEAVSAFIKLIRKKTNELVKPDPRRFIWELLVLWFLSPITRNHAFHARARALVCVWLRKREICVRERDGRERERRKVENANSCYSSCCNGLPLMIQTPFSTTVNTVVCLPFHLTFWARAAYNAR